MGNTRTIGDTFLKEQKGWLFVPLPESDVSQKSMGHKLALWYAKSLPADSPLLK